MMPLIEFAHVDFAYGDRNVLSDLDATSLREPVHCGGGPKRRRQDNIVAPGSRYARSCVRRSVPEVQRSCGL